MNDEENPIIGLLLRMFCNRPLSLLEATFHHFMFLQAPHFLMCVIGGQDLILMLFVGFPPFVVDRLKRPFVLVNLLVQLVYQTNEGRTWGVLG